MPCSAGAIRSLTVEAVVERRSMSPPPQGVQAETDQTTCQPAQDVQRHLPVVWQRAVICPPESRAVTVSRAVTAALLWVEIQVASGRTGVLQWAALTAHPQMTAPLWRKGNFRVQPG